ncbi:FAD-dependent oxidoreductase (plasmid) [Paracoccus pantotrophus]|uniref:FAD-dependent oxidoreductase n=2 Tax=Paracoccaceae TaxID=31989 RepID=A0A7H9C0Y8_PARPN|nr:FAD-dependent oxidoreductase [Paracoccus pantotrophus]RDD99691.1 FAD-dependent oxidoreductase [Paracoccus pantotrophus]WGR66131.1 FAD-dependent oxidoreductase [Paracoccus pantotrophus]SFO59702.1 3-oxosteroid 1-dehydrogenase [Paracoccus pantotrophus]
MEMRSGNSDAADSVVVVGGGLSGIATAIALADRGRPVVLLEAGAKMGGAAAYSGGQVWVGANHVALREGIEGDSKQRAESYIRAIAHRFPEYLDEQAMRRWIDTAPDAMRYWEETGAIRWAVIPGLADYHNEAEGAMPAGRYLTNAPITRDALGAWRDKLLISPYFPVGLTYAELFERGRRISIVDETADEDEGGPIQGFGQSERRAALDGGPEVLTFGPGVVGSFLARAIRDPRITILLGHRVTRLKSDASGRVVGVVATCEAGMAEFDGPVVLATSTFDNDPDLVREIVGLDPEQWGSVGPKTLRGDGIRLARSVGGAVVKLPPSAQTMQPGWKSDYNEGFSYGPDTAMPHTMIVNRHGRRYCDDSYWVDIAQATMDDTAENLPFFLIFDEQHHRKYGLGMTPPGADYPEGLVTSAPTLRELASKLGIDPDGLEATAERFNRFAETGIDEDFSRGTRDFVRRFYGDPAHQPNPVLGSIAQAPFHGLRLRFVAAAVGNSGIHVDGEGRVLDEAGAVIPGLHGVGSCTAQTVTGTGYNSGIALGRGLAMAYLVARDITGAN